MITNYRFCPECGAPLLEGFRHGRLRPVCSACGAVVFIEPKVAVVARVTEGDHVLLVRRRMAPEAGKWALPGGFMDAGEMPEPALRRELQEETGLEVEIGALLGSFALTDANDKVVGIVLAYEATIPGSPLHADGLPQGVAGDDAGEATWWPAEELPTEIAFDSTRLLLAEWVARRRAMRPPAGPAT